MISCVVRLLLLRLRKLSVTVPPMLVGLLFPRGRVEIHDDIMARSGPPSCNTMHSVMLHFSLIDTKVRRC